MVILHFSKSLHLRIAEKHEKVVTILSRLSFEIGFLFNLTLFASSRSSRYLHIMATEDDSNADSE